MASEARSAQFEVLRNLLTDNPYADLTLRCHGKEFKLNKAIVCAQSPFFAKACSEGRWKEAEGVITLGDETEPDDISIDQPVVIDLMIQHMYGGHYEIDNGTLHLSEADVADDLDHSQFERQNNAAINDSLSDDSKDMDYTSADELQADDEAGDTDESYDSGSDVSSEHTSELQTCTPRSALSFTPLEIRTARLVIHAKLYAAGEKYDIASLKAVARDKFDAESKGQQWTVKALSLIIDTVFRTTLSSDRSLRNTLALVLVEWPCTTALMNDKIAEVEGLALAMYTTSSQMHAGSACQICHTIEIRACRTCELSKEASSTASRCFVTCKCRPMLWYCKKHRRSGSGDVVQDIHTQLLRAYERDTAAIAERVDGKSGQLSTTAYDMAMPT